MILLFVGDVMLGRLVNEILKQKPPTHPWGDTLRIFKKANLRICNLECVISDHGQPWRASPKVFHFRTDAKNVAVLKAAAIEVVSLANNHTLDFEYQAMDECLDILDKNKIAHAGCGKNLREVQKPAVLSVGKQKLGFIAFSDNEPDWEATDKKAGIFYVPINLGDGRAQNLLRLIKKIKKEVDFLLVSAHWGPNWGYYPPKEHILFAHAMVDSGADIIFGHSAHVFRGIEIYHKKIILYCCGDFIDDYAVSEIERNDQSFIFEVEVMNNEIVDIKLYPTIITNFQALLAKNIWAKEIAEKMVNLCKKLGTQSVWINKENYLKINL